MDNNSVVVFKESLEDILHKVSIALDISSKLLYGVADNSGEDLSFWTSLHFEYDDITGYIESIKCLDFSDEDAEQHQISRAIELTEDAQETIIAMKVATKALNDLEIIPESDFVYMNAYLTALSLFRRKLQYEHYELNYIFEQNESWWNSIEEGEDTNDEEGSYVDLCVSFMYQEIRTGIDNILSYYSEKMHRPRLTEFYNYVMESLDKFNNDEVVSGFSFDFNYRYNEESNYISFLLENNSITITKGGSAYSSEVGHDDYTNWMFTLWNNGEYNGELVPFVDESIELIDLGAELSIAEPEEYEDWNKKYSKLTNLIEKLQGAGDVGSWVFDNARGTDGNLIVAPHVKYSPVVDEVYNGIMNICEENPELEHAQYWVTLSKYGIDATPWYMENADVSDKDAKFVIALLIGVYSGERFSDGLIGHFFKKGIILKWIERLKEIDDDLA